MKTKHDVYRMIPEECARRGLKFEHIGREIAEGPSLGFLITGNQQGVFSQGVVCESRRRKDPYRIWHGLKEHYFSFFEFTEAGEAPEQRQNFVVFLDAIFGHYFCIPYEALKGELRDKKNDLYPQKQFDIVVEGGAYRLKRTKHLLNRYMDTLEPLFRVFDAPRQRKI